MTSLWSVYVTNDHWYVPLVVIAIRFVTRVARRVPLVEQDLLTLPELMGSLLISGVPFFHVVLLFLHVFCSILWCPLLYPRKNDVLYSHLFCEDNVLYVTCICIYLYLFTHTCVQHDFHIAKCWCRLAVTRRVPLVEHHSSLFVISGVHVTQSLVFRVVFCRPLYVFFPCSFCQWIVCPSFFLFASSVTFVNRV